MKSPFRVTLMAILAWIGAAISIYQSNHFFEIRNAPEGFSSFCTFGSHFDCDAIELSKYAELIPGFPLSGFAAGWLFALGLIALFARNPFTQKKYLKVTFLMSAIGSAFSLFYLFIMAFVLQKWCLLCLFIDVINFSIFGMALSLKASWKDDGPMEKGFLKSQLITISASVAVAVLVSKMFDRSPVDQDRANLLFDKVVSTQEKFIDIQPTDIIVGPKDAPVTIVKFSDYQCPACKIGAVSLHPVLRRYKDQVRFVSKNYPLSAKCNPAINSAMHPYACDAAKVAICSHQKGIFLEVYETMFEKQAGLDDQKAIDIAVSHGFDRNELIECMNSPETQAKLAKEVEIGNEIPIRATPTFYINGHKVEGVTPTQVWMKLVKHYLKNQS